MDPKGDRLRKIQSGQLKLPDSVLKSSNIVLTPARGTGGCLEGGPRPRPSNDDDEGVAENGSMSGGVIASLPGFDMDDIPLPAKTDMSSIPLPISMDNIPLPEMIHENIPLPSDASIPLPADKPPAIEQLQQQSERRKIKVSLEHLESHGDELLCRSCVMKFSKQLDYDLHLQSEEHEQAIKADLLDGKVPSASLLNQRTDKKSPGHDNKSGHVSFSFKKNIGSRITSTQPFRREDRRASPVEIKLLQLESEASPAVGPTEDVDTKPTTEDTENKDFGDGSEKVESKSELVEEEKVVRLPVMSSFVKVQSKDESGRVLDWPKEMIQMTVTEPKLMYSCNPLSFDFSQLSKSKKSPARADLGTSIGAGVVGADVKTGDEEGTVQKEGDVNGKPVEEKKRSHKKKKRKKHKKSKDKPEGTGKEEDKDGAVKTGTGAEEELNTSGTSGGKKKKKKHKRKEEKVEAVIGCLNKDEKPSGGGEAEEGKKRHKKSRRKSKQAEGQGDGEKIEGEEMGEKKHKKKRKKSKRRKKKHHTEGSELDKSVEGEAATAAGGAVATKDKRDSESEKESDGGDKEKEGKKRRKKHKKHKTKETGDRDSSDSETEAQQVKTEITDSVNSVLESQTHVKRKFPGTDSDTEKDKFVAKLLALSRTKASKLLQHNNVNVSKKVKKEPVEAPEKKTPSDRKRLNSESSITETTPNKKHKITPKASGVKDNVPVSATAPAANILNVTIKTEKEESWSKIETQTNDNMKSKWDTSESDMDNALDDTLKKEKKVLKKRAPARPVKPSLLKELKSPTGTGRPKVKTEHEARRSTAQGSSQRSSKSNVSIDSAKPTPMQRLEKARKSLKSPASSRSRSHHRSYSRSGSSSRSRSRSYSSSSYYSDDSRHSRRHRRRGRRSSSRSYSRSSSRSRSRSYHRHRGRSSSYSDYSRSRSYSSSRSRSRSHRRRKRSYSRRSSRSYSSSSYSSHSRSRNRYRRSRRKNRRKRRSLSVSSVEKVAVSKKAKPAVAEKEKVTEEKVKVKTLDIPLPDLSGKKEDERSEEKLAKLKEKKPRTDVGETVAKLVESLPADIPLPFSDGDIRTVSSDSLPHGSPKDAPKENDSGFIGPKMPGPPPPPPMLGGRYPNHGPPGPPRPNYGPPGQWDHWDPHGWDGPPGPWDGPGPGPRQPYRGMRPPHYDPRWNGPYDPRRRGPPSHYMNRPRGMGPYSMGPRYPGPHGPPHEYPHDYDYENYPPQQQAPAEEEPDKSKSPPPLPKEPPKVSSPNPPLPKKKETKKEPEQNPDIVIPPEQAEQYKQLQKQAAKHARRQLRRQAKKDLGEPDEDSTSSESEQEEAATSEVAPEEVAVIEEPAPQLVAVPQQVVLQPQQAPSPSGAYVMVSGGQHYIVQKQPVVQAGLPIQAGQPVIAVSQGAHMMNAAASAVAAAAGAHPAHIVQHVPVQAGPTMLAHTPSGVQVVSSAHIQQIQHAQQIQQIQQIQQMQQMQQIQQIQAHNQAVAMAAAAAQQHGPILVGNQILVPKIGIRPGL